MSTKEEVGSDTRARRLLERTNPLIALPGIGISGDQIPANLFDVEDFEQERRNLFLNLDNYEVINTLNALAQITNIQSQSGPIPGTQLLLDTTSITNSEITVYRPAVGTVYQLIAASITTLDGASSMILKLSDDTSTPGAQIDTFNSTSNPLELNEPIFLSHDVWLKVRTSDASSGNARLATSLIRVR